MLGLSPNHTTKHPRLFPPINPSTTSPSTSLPTHTQFQIPPWAFPTDLALNQTLTSPYPSSHPAIPLTFLQPLSNVQGTSGPHKPCPIILPHSVPSKGNTDVPETMSKAPALSPQFHENNNNNKKKKLQTRVCVSQGCGASSYFKTSAFKATGGHVIVLNSLQTVLYSEQNKNTAHFSFKGRTHLQKVESGFFLFCFNTHVQ